MWAGVRDYFDFNRGAIDILVVRQEDGSLCSTPFHVRFGKGQILRDEEKIVDIDMNGVEVDLKMHLGEAGEAYFLLDSAGKEIPPTALYTSSGPAAIGDAKDSGANEAQQQVLRDKQSGNEDKEPKALEKPPSPAETRYQLAHEYMVSSPPSITSTTDMGEPQQLPPKKWRWPWGGLPSKSQSPYSSLSSSFEDIGSVMGNDAVKPTVKVVPPASSETSDKEKTEKAEKTEKQDKPGEGEKIDGTAEERSKWSGFFRLFHRNETEPVYLIKPIESDFYSSLYGDDEFDEQVDDNFYSASISPRDYTSNPNSPAIRMPRNVSIEEFHTDFSDSDLDMKLDSDEDGEDEDGDAAPVDESDEDIFVCEDLDGSDNKRVAKKGKAKEEPQTPVDTPRERANDNSDNDPDVENNVEKENGWANVTREHNVKPRGLGNMGEENSICPVSDSIGEGGAVKEAVTQNGEAAAENGNGHAEAEKEPCSDEPETFSAEAEMHWYCGAVPNSTTLNGQHPDSTNNTSTNSNNEPEPHIQQSEPKVIERQLALVPVQEPEPTASESPIPPSSTSLKGLSGLRSLDDLSVQISLCGSLLLKSASTNSQDLQGLFDKHMISYEEFLKKPTITSDNDVLYRIQGKIYPARVAQPLLMSYLLFRQPLSEELIEELQKHEIKEKAAPKSGWSGWWWRSSTTVTVPPVALPPPAPVAEVREKTPESPVGERTLRPTSEMLGRLGLKEGQNLLTFSVTSGLRGKLSVTASVYLWAHDTKIVVSDIDGTITKSDLLGHILPVLRVDWSHSGVAQLYTNIVNNGYKILYLTSRSIGQTNQTRRFLSELSQADTRLPPGPIFTAPNGLLRSVHREVIRRAPEEFKIVCLKDICNLFPSRALYSGFGNRASDVISYRAVGIPLGKIFTINPHGEIRIPNHTYKKSYMKLNDLVHEMFPALNKKVQVEEEYNTFQYWKTPLPLLEELGDL